MKEKLKEKLKEILEKIPIYYYMILIIIIGFILDPIYGYSLLLFGFLMPLLNAFYEVHILKMLFYYFLW